MRIQSVDVFRFLAILAVIAIHTIPFQSFAHSESTLYTAMYFGINQIARFAVPFFFVISGYFWALKIRSGNAPFPVSRSMAKRILTIFLAWNLVYILPYNLAGLYEYGLLGPLKLAYWKIQGLIENPHYMLFQGSKVHLWFLVSLILSLLICTIFIHLNHQLLLLGFATLLYIVGVLGKSYIDTPIGLDFEFNTRNGPFFSTLFFTLGYFLSGFRPKEQWIYAGFAFFISGLVMQASEVYIIWKLFNSSLQQDYTFGTILIGLGASIMALSNHPIFRLKSLGKIGSFTLGIFACHFIFVDWFQPLGPIVNHPLWEVSYVFIVFLLSLMTVLLISKHPIGRKIVI